MYLCPTRKQGIQSGPIGVNRRILKGGRFASRVSPDSFVSAIRPPPPPPFCPRVQDRSPWHHILGTTFPKVQFFPRSCCRTTNILGSSNSPYRHYSHGRSCCCCWVCCNCCLFKSLNNTIVDRLGEIAAETQQHRKEDRLPTPTT